MTDSRIRFNLHQVDHLRQYCQSISTRPFVARGANLTRCPSCLMAHDACFCDARVETNLPIEIVLLYHIDEIHKPTNSGRLIADLFPKQTHAFLWSRKDPESKLLELLNEEDREIVLLFPDVEKKNTSFEVNSETSPSSTKKTTLILFDATWKQASKMFHLSKWLRNYHCLNINMEKQKAFLVRHAKHDMQFATAEVTAMALNALGHHEKASQLMQYNATFNQHCLMSRKRSGQVKANT